MAVSQEPRHCGSTYAAWVRGGPDCLRIEGVEILAKVCDAVAFAHVRGIVHRDIKPGNVTGGRSAAAPPVG